jgi:hypothetical protein
MVPSVQSNAGFPACVHLAIRFNDHAVNYQSVEEWLIDQGDGSGECWFEWASADERDKAIVTNKVWTCQWYPNTPVGFYAVAASSYEVLMAAVNSRGQEAQ